MKKRLSLLLAFLLMFFYLPAAVAAEMDASPEPVESFASKEPESRNETEQVPSGKSAVDDDLEMNDSDVAPTGQIEEDMENVTASDGDLSSLTATPPEMGDPNKVYDWDVLEAWLNENEDTGVTVTLGSDIEVTGNGYIATQSDGVTIDAGAYGFVVSGCLDIDAGVHITGEGGQSPVIRVLDGGELYFRSDSFEDAATIAVTGRGGCGIVLENGANYDATFDSYVKLSASGADSVALKSEIVLDLRCYFIEAEGAGAQGIVSTQPVRLYLSHIITDGAAVTASEVVLDTCVVSPQVPEAYVISRKITGLKSYMSILIEAGEGIPGQFADYGPQRCFATLHAEGVEDEDESVWVQFNDFALPYGTPGQHLMPANLMAPYDLFDLVSAESPPGMTVTVFDPSVPSYRESASLRGVLTLLYLYTGDLADLTLWRSDNEGQSWYVYWRDGDPEKENFFIDYNGYYLTLRFGSPQEFVAPALLAFEVGDGMGSCVLRVQPGAGGGMGGDRDGGDRITMLPWEIFAHHNGGGSLDLTPAESDDADHSGTQGSGANLLNKPNLISRTVPQKPDKPDSATSENRSAMSQMDAGADRRDPILEPSNPFIQPELAVPDSARAGESSPTAATFPDQSNFPMEHQSDPDGRQPAFLIPSVAVTAGILSVGGAGGLTWIFRRKRVFRRR